MDKVFLNDKLIDADKACISASDSGFLYGAGLFETMRSQNGVVFALADHLDRLFFSSRSLSISNPYDKGFIKDAVYEVLDANKLSDARLRITFTNGPMVEAEDDRTPTLLITATKFRSYPPEYYKNGVMVILCPFRQNPDDPTCGHKTTSYYSRMIALNMAHQKRAAEALWFTADNRLAEGCVSNVFLVKDSVLLTPPIETPVLAGVARKTVCRLAVSNSIELVDKDLTIDDLLGADEVFLTNVIMQVMPITKIEKHTVGDGKVGPVVKKLQRSFAEYVENECEKRRGDD
ncbi:MAG: aminotransferase class IV [Planctomycetota bacterium]|jgi:D-amino acid aminotransferase